MSLPSWIIKCLSHKALFVQNDEDDVLDLPLEKVKQEIEEIVNGK